MHFCRNLYRYLPRIESYALSLPREWGGLNLGTYPLGLPDWLKKSIFLRESLLDLKDQLTVSQILRSATQTELARRGEVIEIDPLTHLETWIDLTHSYEDVKLLIRKKQFRLWYKNKGFE